MTKSINPMVTLLESGTYGIVSATRSLTRAYRQLAFEIVKTKQADFQNRMELWIARTYSNSLSREKSSVKGNTSRALAEDKISWGTFMKGIDILGFNKTHIKIVCLKRDSVYDGVYTINKLYKALLNGDGYLRGEILVYGIGYSFDTHEILYEIWVNKTTGIQINNLKSASGLKEITDTKEINIFIPDISTEYSKAKDSTD